MRFASIHKPPSSEKGLNLQPAVSFVRPSQQVSLNKVDACIKNSAMLWPHNSKRKGPGAFPVVAAAKSHITIAVQIRSWELYPPNAAPWNVPRSTVWYLFSLAEHDEVARFERRFSIEPRVTKWITAHEIQMAAALLTFLVTRALDVLTNHCQW